MLRGASMTVIGMLRRGNAVTPEGQVWAATDLPAVTERAD
jgi:hypothetical protein